MADTNTKAKAPAKSTRARKATAAQTASVEAALAQSPLEMVAFADLADTEFNARLIPHTQDEIESLAVTIKAVGILQNLIVINLPDGRRGVVGGRGRMTATALLVEQGFITADQPFVPVKAIPVELANDASYIENVQRKAMHPAEQLISFRTRAERGQTPAQIADLLGYSVRHVERTLKLANLAPELIQELARDAITLEQCQALSLTDSHEHQMEIWRSAKSQYGDQSPSTGFLRSKIVNDSMTTDAPLFRFIGLDAYKAEGGVLRQDLFTEENTGWADNHLVRKIALEKLEREAQRLQQEEGWGWSLARIERVSEYHPDNKTWCFMMPDPDFTPDEQVRYEILSDAVDATDNYDDENDLQQQLEDLEAAAVNRQLTPEFKAGLGVAVSVNRATGELEIQRALGKVEMTSTAAANTASGNTATNDSEQNGVITMRPPVQRADSYAVTLVEALSSERTLAVQAVLASTPGVAIALLTWKFCREVFDGEWCSNVQDPLRINLHQQTLVLRSDAPSGLEGKASQALLALQHELQATLPANWKQDFTWLLNWSDEDVQKLLAFCVATAVDGVQKRANSRTDSSPLETLETALDIDLYDWWQPTSGNYFRNITKDQISEAVHDAGFSGRARDLMKLKKADAAELAEDTLADTRWVPDWMTRPQATKAEDSTDATDTAHAA
jgi:ParB family chromosome partitioning protein